jgi:hypothetical protein
MSITKFVPVAKTDAQSVAPEVVSKAKSQTTIMVEELISIQAQLDAIAANKLIKRAEEIKKALQQVMKDSGADEAQPYVFKAPTGTVEFGPCSNTTEVVDKPLMIKLLGTDTFMKIAKVGVTDLKTYLSGSEIEQCTTKTSGSRSIKSVKAAE